MFKRSFASKDRVGKIAKPVKRSFRNEREKQRFVETVNSQERESIVSPSLTSPIATVMVGPEQRLFAAHENVLSASPFFASAIRDAFFQGGPGPRRIYLPEEEPECFSAVLEYMYKGDYYPRLSHDKRRNTWELDSTIGPESPRFPGDELLTSIEPTIYHYAVGDRILRDTAVYCAAGKYGLDELQRLALRKQGLQSGIEVAVILRSARFCYDHTPDHDSRLRAHYLALIVRSRKTFKRSGTMQKEMEIGGLLFFDLFVAMCNHVDDMDQQQVFPGFSISVCSAFAFRSRFHFGHDCVTLSCIYSFRLLHASIFAISAVTWRCRIANRDLAALPEAALPEERPEPSKSCTSTQPTDQQFSTQTGNKQIGYTLVSVNSPAANTLGLSKKERPNSLLGWSKQAETA